MFPLGDTRVPTSGPELVESIVNGLRPWLIFPTGATPVRLVGGAWPQLEEMRVDLSGARSVERPPAPPDLQVRDRRPLFSARRLALVARPLIIEEAPVELSLTASDARFDFAVDSRQRAVLLPSAAREGRFNARIGRADLESLVRRGITLAAESQGVSVTSTELKLSQRGDREIEAQVKVKARKMFISAVVRAGGRMEVDDHLNAVLHDLRCQGEGIAGEVACAALRPHVQKWNGQRFPLSGLPIAGLRLHDLKLSANDPLTVEASFEA